MGYGDVAPKRPSMETKKTMRIPGMSISAVELRAYLEGLPDGASIRVRPGGGLRGDDGLIFETVLD